MKVMSAMTPQSAILVGSLGAPEIDMSRWRRQVGAALMKAD